MNRGKREVGSERGKSEAASKERGVDPRTTGHFAGTGAGARAMMAPLRFAQLWYVAVCLMAISVNQLNRSLSTLNDKALKATIAIGRL